MKNFKKFTAAVAATLMAATMVAPMALNAFAEGEDDTIPVAPSNTLTVGANPAQESDKGVHTYEAYQIFSAEGLTTDGILTGIDWGLGVKEESISDIYTALAAISVSKDGATVNPFTKADNSALESAKEVADVLGEYKKDDEAVQKFADVVADYLSDTKTSEDNSKKLTIDSIGYYLVQDAKAPESNGAENSGAKTRYILNVVEAGKELTVNPKSAAPTVDKEVLDETTEGTPIEIDGNNVATGGEWGETADHAINETFQFKLTAAIPTDTEIDAYDKYHVTFNDSMSAGVTFDEIASVKVYKNADDSTGTAVSEYNAESNKNGYYETATTASDKAGLSWTLTIADIKDYLDGSLLSGGVRVEVIYNAHLNEDAIRHSASNGENGQSYIEDENVKINYNDVFLNYSNNPNFKFEGDSDSEKPEDKEEEGETPKDTVGVFTYDVNNTKVDGEGKSLNGAEFVLYASDPDAVDEEGNKLNPTPITLVYDASVGGYRLPKDGETGTTTITSQGETGEGENKTELGKFNFVGLDAGTYYLKETNAPEGYNPLNGVVKMEIVAVHSENADGAGAKLDLDASQLNKATWIDGVEVTDLSQQVVNEKGTSLPSTGGIGTTLFYLGGGAMVAVAGVFLITKKRMKKEEL